MDTNQLLGVLTSLEVSVSGTETDQQLRDLLVQKLDKRDKLITCS